MSVLDQPPGRLALGDLALGSGEVLTGASIVYSDIHPDGEVKGVVLVPTWFCGTAADFDWLVGPGRTLDTEQYRVIIVEMFGNGRSTSPSNWRANGDEVRFPNISIADNVAAQHQLISTHLGIEHVNLIFGASLGGAQAVQWAIDHPGMVKSLVVACGSSGLTDHAYVFTRGLQAALRAEVDSFTGAAGQLADRYDLRAFATVLAGWSPSQQFYWAAEYKRLGFDSAASFIDGFFVPWFADRDPRDVASQLRTWQSCHPSRTSHSRSAWSASLAAIESMVYVCPAKRDQYFPVEDAAWEVEQLAQAELRVIPGDWGHFCLSGLEPESAAFIRSVTQEALAHPVGGAA